MNYNYLFLVWKGTFFLICYIENWNYTLGYVYLCLQTVDSLKTFKKYFKVN